MKYYRNFYLASIPSVEILNIQICINIQSLVIANKLD